MASQELDDSLFLKHFRPKPPNLLIKDKISDGIFGEVYSGFYNDKEVTVKKLGALFLEYSHGSEKPLEVTTDVLKKELRAYRAHSYPYITETLGVFYDTDLHQPLLVLETLKEDLNTYLTRKKGDLSVPEQLVLAMQIATALRYLHLSEPSDQFHYLSDKSIFLSEKSVVKLLECKQTLVKLKEPHQSSHNILPFLPPEVMSASTQYSHEGDVFSLGILLLKIATQKTGAACNNGKTPTSKTNLEERAQNVALLHDDHPLKKVISLCLEDKPSRRPDIIKVHSEMSQRVEGPKSVFRGDLVLQGQQKLHSWTFPRLPQLTAFASGVFINGRIYIGGGRSSDTDTARNVYVYSLLEKAWSLLPPAPQIYSQMVVVNGHLTLVGGCDADNWKVTNRISQWDSKKKKWTQDLKPMRAKRVRPATTVHKGFLIVAGGLGEDLTHPLDSFEMTDLVKWEWVLIPKLHLPKPLSCLQIIDKADTLYLAGGVDGEKMPSTAMWCVSSKEVIQAFESTNKKSKSKNPSKQEECLWTERTPVPFSNATFVSGGSVPLCVGGTDSGQKGLSPNILAYSVSAGKWALAGSLHVSRCHACVVTLSSTSLLVTGGYRHPKSTEESMIDESELIYL